jgi:1-acyl-sn-glycerol-3-phosphate acyltransferase
MNRFLRWIVFVCLLRPFLTFILGLNIRHLEKLPKKGPAIIVANHNSHLDVPVIVSLFPTRMLSKLRPVAAADYFLRNPLLRWFSTRIIGIVPIARSRDRGASPSNPLAPISEVLNRGDIIIFFPEGTRGKPEQLAEMKAGIAILAHKHQDVPIVPIFIYGLGKSLPRGEALLVPFFIDIFVGDPLYWTGEKSTFLANLSQSFATLSKEDHIAEWN